MPPPPQRRETTWHLDTLLSHAPSVDVLCGAMAAAAQPAAADVVLGTATLEGGLVIATRVAHLLCKRACVPCGLASVSLACPPACAIPPCSACDREPHTPPA